MAVFESYLTSLSSIFTATATPHDTNSFNVLYIVVFDKLGIDGNNDW